MNTGCCYNRAANNWSVITTTNAPSSRTERAAVWGGTRMIAWGGSAGQKLLHGGGIDNPLTDGCLAVLLDTNTPPERALHAAVWTGSEMVVHGGYNADAFTSATTCLDDAWHYTPLRTMFLYLKP